MPPTSSPQVWADQLQIAVASMQRILSGSDHAMLRGTFEAAIAEAQGAQIVQSSGEVAKHLGNLENAVRGLVASDQQITTILRQLSARDPRAAGEISNALRPLLDMARQRIDLAARTPDLLFEIETTAAQSRFAGVPIEAAGRTVDGLVSSQLSRVSGLAATRGMFLVPPGLVQAPWVQQTIREIEELPVTISQATSQAAAAAAVARGAIQASLRGALTAASSTALRVIGTALEALWAVSGRLITFPFIILPVDEKGNLVLPGSRPPPPDA